MRAQEIKLNDDSGGGTDVIATDHDKGEGATVCKWNHHSFAHIGLN